MVARIRRVLLGAGEHGPRTFLVLILTAGALTIGGYALDLVGVDGMVIVPIVGGLVGFGVATAVGYLRGGVVTAVLGAYPPLVGPLIEGTVRRTDGTVPERLAVIDPEYFAFLGVIAFQTGIAGVVVGYLARTGVEFVRRSGTPVRP
ncbi:hypothetical protein [Haloarcula salinisoli]|uniref:Uncharacterized protein n=1 Tax=Haloarcula salinisoli TaxID=2487746 RepID=A0A8J7YI86_9EURY|nr:hypothetical protein [Halomicroarcula salinisoli]MBX0303826.1 hypothetical protein [Halomicroarcula salinisoli]